MFVSSVCVFVLTSDTFKPIFSIVSFFFHYFSCRTTLQHSLALFTSFSTFTTTTHTTMKRGRSPKERPSDGLPGNALHRDMENASKDEGLRPSLVLPLSPLLSLRSSPSLSPLNS